MCKMMLNYVIDISNVSVQMLDAWSASMKNVYSPYEAISQNSYEACMYVCFVKDGRGRQGTKVDIYLLLLIHQNTTQRKP
jgi:hypothetical protein